MPLPTNRKENLIDCLTKVYDFFFQCLPLDFILDYTIKINEDDECKYTEEELEQNLKVAWGLLNQVIFVLKYYGDNSDSFWACHRCLERRVWEIFNNGTENAPRLLKETPPYKRLYYADKETK
jgi:hypothetical protein